MAEDSGMASRMTAVIMRMMTSETPEIVATPNRLNSGLETCP